MRYQVTKNLVGAYSIKFTCPECGVKLTEALNNAGKADACPDCGSQFTIPGENALAEHQTKIQQQKAEEGTRKARKAEAKEKAAQERLRERRLEQLAREKSQAAKEREAAGEREIEQPKPVYQPQPPTPGRDSGVALGILSAIAFAVAALNLLTSESAENVMQQIVFTLRFYGAAACGCVLLVGSCLCLAIAKASK